MITQTTDDPISEDAKKVINEGEVTRVYFADDQEVIDDERREGKRNQQMQLHDALKTALTEGYTSNATGADVIYSIDTEDMQDLNGLIGLNIAGEYREKNGKFKAHTLAQLKQVRNEGVVYKFDLYKKHEVLMVAVNSAETVTEIEAITW